MYLKDVPRGLSKHSEVSLGDGLGCSEANNIDGSSDFNLEGLFDGVEVGSELGDTDGGFEGHIIGTSDFNLEGLFHSVGVGSELGDTDGGFEGHIDGASDFNLEGRLDAEGVGDETGEFVGGDDGEESSPPPQTQHA